MALPSSARRYSLAAATAVAAVGLARALPWLSLHARLLVPLAATAACASALGAGPALLCLLASSAAAPFVVLEGGWAALMGDDAAAVGLFTAAALVPIWASRRERGAARLRLEAERRARRAAEAESRAKDEFLATLSHELRGPVGSILGWADLLRGGLGEHDARRAIDSIARNARTQEQLVSEVLDVARISSGTMRLALAEVDLAAIVTAALDTVRPKALGKGVSLEARTPERGLAVRGDGARLLQVATNLLDNAVKFTPRGGCVVASLARRGERVRLEITDTGLGIPAELIPLLFERYRQVHAEPGRARDGLGLGLSIVRHLVERHGGSVRASSAGVDRGTTFAVELPIDGPGAIEAAPPGASAAAADRNAPAASGRAAGEVAVPAKGIDR